MLGRVLENGNIELNERAETFEQQFDKFSYNRFSQDFFNVFIVIMIEEVNRFLKFFFLFEKII